MTKNTAFEAKAGDPKTKKKSQHITESFYLLLKRILVATKKSLSDDSKFSQESHIIQ
jgi:hypothetical protein